MKLKTQKLTDGYSNEGYTPIPFYEKLNAEFKFDLDSATTKDNRLGTKEFFTEEDNGIDKEGKGNVFCNPPYSNIELGVKKAKEEGERDRERVIVLLIPARTDTRYFHDHIVPFAEVRFVKGRIKFSEKGSAPFPSMVVIYGKEPNIKTQERRS